ncbi:conserved hypothetical protein [Culex quinquefasciatus]|uniref:C2 tensin-type domain-containing protein n=1 Tax=Culex quinquefasciatus TaxID=7176 RepID=B0WEZ9_CULQU|nr:conserved hypothetical protein [Culex quinquefasciatus]|eukprot:XP_001847283.1 conserved hypothetical protein [Culex quinquefasciatus]
MRGQTNLVSKNATETVWDRTQADWAPNRVRALFFSFVRLFSELLEDTVGRRFSSPEDTRYIRYFSGLLAGTIKMNASSVFLRAIIVESPPCLHYRAVTVNSEWRSFIKVYEGVRCLFTSDIYVIPITTRQFIYEIKHPLRLRGDVLVRCYQIIPNNNKLHDEKELVSAVQFHTCAITEKEVQFAKLELDLACDDERFPADHKLTLCIDTVPNEKSAILVFQNPLVRIEPIIENGDHLETINGGVRVRETLTQSCTYLTNQYSPSRTSLKYNLKSVLETSTSATPIPARKSITKIYNTLPSVILDLPSSSSTRPRSRRFHAPVPAFELKYTLKSVIEKQFQKLHTKLALAAPLCAPEIKSKCFHDMAWRASSSSTRPELARSGKNIQCSMTPWSSRCPDHLFVLCDDSYNCDKHADAKVNRLFPLESHHFSPINHVLNLIFPRFTLEIPKTTSFGILIDTRATPPSIRAVLGWSSSSSSGKGK